MRYTPLVLPVYLPPGFHVSNVDVKDLHASPEPFLEGFTVTYIRGKDKITWNSANGTGGFEDAGPETLQYVYHSRGIRRRCRAS